MSTARTVEQLYSPEQAAGLLAVSVFTVRRWIAAGKLQAYRINRKVMRIPASTINRFLEARAL